MKKIEVINGLRGMAILGVIYHHLFYRYTYSGYQSFELFNTKILPFTYLSNGWLGVNLFFVLSGFVLAYPYLAETRAIRNPGDVKGFYINRAKRLLPLYYFFLLTSVIFIVRPIPFDDLIRELLLMGTATFIFTKEMWFPRYNFALWSIGIEIWFSAIFPFIIIGVRKYGIYKTLSAILILSLGVRILGNGQILAPPPFTPLLDPVRDSLLGRLDDFAWGIVVCHIYLLKPVFIMKANKLILFLLGMILVTVACSLWDYAALSIVSYQVVPFINIILDLGFSLIITALLFMDRNFIKWCFSNAIIQLMGLMCYSLYIWHAPALKLVRHHDLAHVTYYLASVFLISCLSYRFIEFGKEKNARWLFFPGNNKK